jgi:hypothetical protein
MRSQPSSKGAVYARAHLPTQVEGPKRESPGTTVLGVEVWVEYDFAFDDGTYRVMRRADLLDDALLGWVTIDQVIAISGTEFAVRWQGQAVLNYGGVIHTRRNLLSLQEAVEYIVFEHQEWAKRGPL